MEGGKGAVEFKASSRTMDFEEIGTHGEPMFAWL